MAITMYYNKDYEQFSINCQNNMSVKLFIFNNNEYELDYIVVHVYFLCVSRYNIKYFTNVNKKTISARKIAEPRIYVHVVY